VRFNGEGVTNITNIGTVNLTNMVTVLGGPEKCDSPTGVRGGSLTNPTVNFKPPPSAPSGEQKYKQTRFFGNLMD
jgi:hypothetical protein